jgi:hypothetical protein
MLAPLLLAVVSATFRPAAPTVGDPITIELRAPVRLDPSPQFEVVRSNGRQVVIRTFEARPLVLNGTAGEVRFRGLTVPVRSVLPPNDALEPAPLQPPVALPAARTPIVAIVIAAIAAVLAWGAVVLLARRRGSRTVVTPVGAAQRFRSHVEMLRASPSAAHRWAALADATRAYLSARAPTLGLELTTAQLLAHLRPEHVPLLSHILGQGDLEKFSPWGAPEGDFGDLARRALEIIDWLEPHEEVAA